MPRDRRDRARRTRTARRRSSDERARRTRTARRRDQRTGCISFAGFWFLLPDLMHFLQKYLNEPALICLCYSRFVFSWICGLCFFDLCYSAFFDLCFPSFQTPENIFRKIFCNATKHHGNIFLFQKLAFPENMYFPEIVLQQPNTALDEILHISTPKISNFAS